MAKSLFYTIAVSFLGLVGCSHGKKINTVENVDLVKYAGKWYEIASFPTPFQKGCQCTTAEYFITGKKFIRVVNSCRVGEKFKKIQGKAFVTKGSNNSKLKVQFFWPFRGAYWIIDIDPEYRWAVVSNPAMKYLWILSRDPSMDDATYNAITSNLKNKGFDISRLVKTRQNCNQ